MAYDEDSVLRRGRGRPKKDGSRKDMICIRLDEDEKDMLSHLEIESDDNKSDILRKALRSYYRIESKKW